MNGLTREAYRQRVYGCWLGKTVGGTLGQPHEGKQALLDLSFYDPVPEGAIANDDLDLQLVWLAALREDGPDLDERALGRWWRRGLQYPFDEYGMALWNLERGVEPPASGRFANHFTDCMGAPIRSEIWACVAPGCPALAARYAWCDACVDHADEGIWGEVFFAALESAAFLVDDRDRLLDIGLAMIPASSRTAAAVRLTRELHAGGLDWQTARERILAEHGHVNFTDAPQNIAFTVLGWLWGESAGDGICKAVNCGYDTDCTGATLGAILGILHGPEAFEARWTAPVGDEVVVGWGVTRCEVPKDLGELTDWTLEVAERVLAHDQAPVRLDGREAPEPQPVRPASLAEWFARESWQLRFTGRVDGEPVAVIVDLGGPPAVAPGAERTIRVAGLGEGPQPVVCRAPAGWHLETLGPSGGAHRFLLRAPTDVDRAASHQAVIELGADQKLSCPVALLPACGWRVAGPVPVADAGAVPEDLKTGPARLVWTPDHRLRLDDGGETDRVYRIRTVLAIPSERAARLVSATAERQRVQLDGRQVLDKTEPTRFIPAAHRSGPGTATESSTWPAGEHPVEILLAARAGQAAEVHLFLTRPRDIDGPRMVPWADVVHRLPA